MRQFSRASSSLFIATSAAVACSNQSVTQFDRPWGADAGGDLGSLAVDRDAGFTSGSSSAVHEDAGNVGAGVAVTITQPSGATPTSAADSGNPGSVLTPVVDAGVQIAAPDGLPCTGCVRFGIVPSTNANEGADYVLQLPAPKDLSQTVITWRVRLFNYAGSISVIGYADSGDDEVTTGRMSFDATAGWQSVSLDLRSQAALRASSGDAGASDPGAFDKSKVQSIGLGMRADPADSGASRATLELDSVTFSDIPALDAEFSTSQGGFALVVGDATVTEVPK